MEERKSVLVGSPVGQNETVSTHWLSHDHRANQQEKGWPIKEAVFLV
jgi:hypothetical protein